jgi:hypothetical protein
MQLSIDGQVLEGWLEKHGDWLGQWNRRWFRLQGPVLSYKVEPHQPDKGMCHVHGLRTENKGQHIRVWTETSDSWLLRTTDPVVHAEWLKSLKTAVLTHENRVVSGPSEVLRSNSVGSSRESTSDEIRPAAGRARSASRGSRGVSPSDLPAVLPTTELLRSYVKKRSAWLHKWNTRFVVIEGVDMVYSDKEDGKLRGRHTIVAIDFVDEPTDLKIEASDGEDFHLRLDTAEMAKHWLRVVRQSLQTTMTLRWQAVETTCKDGGSVYLRAGNHCACVIDRDGKGHERLFFFGGASSTLPQSAKADERNVLCGELIMVKMTGDHETFKAHPKAFQEGPGALVKPGAREGHAGALVGTRLYVYGGASKSSVLGDMWSIDLSVSMDTLQWVKLHGSVQPPPLPARCGHAMINVDDEIWILGGFDMHGAAVADVTIYDPLNETATLIEPLPHPRARHACAVNAQGNVLVVGGSESPHLSDATNVAYFMDRRSDTGRAWVQVEWTGHKLPKMVAPSLVACGRKGWLLTGSDGEHAVEVYMLQPSKASKHCIAVERLNCAGDTPRMHHGLSSHRIGDYLYVVGDCSTPPIGPSMRRLLLPPAVVKHAPRIPSHTDLADLGDTIHSV